MKKLFVIREAQHFNALVSFVHANWQAMAKAGKPMAARLSEYVEPRTLEANAIMWVWLTKTEQQAWAHGAQFSAKVWNEYFKEQHLPEVNAKGMHKWEAMPDGTRRLIMSTSDLNKDEMTAYLNTIEVDIVGLGVDLTGAAQ